ncbi:MULTISPECIES: hypothetical protein [unclassified Variovorax]|uniref:hypothetical protein n=1 Tax=unclassified Variovorax TaxID=663243 RepID=UPI00076BC94D|nr:MULTISPECIES: hypothetical protein [unclassified Variovorax]KWT98088.1 hypothetical protein APY03_0759 [Variovorax sp. WDL1]PNG50438.1 hypothetical protein CHC06_06062 [Variovorax sp. B2]PNG51311.1 hypothetical protein CHC07_05968 [Variovorax sp. B4]VTU43296.1 hypothetical protein H6P1_00412 [Variovorax sp. PBL-H6]VTU43302.1 hypothetical protein SRS16P1_00493 [Variovorax sp. SRS16]
MHLRTRFLLPLALVAFLAACSQPKDAIIPADSATWEKDLLPKIQKLSDDDRAALAAYLVRAKMGEAFGGKTMPLGTTVGQAIDQQKAFAAQQAVKAAEEQALKEKLRKEQEEAAAALNRIVTVTLLEKKELAPNYEQRRYSQEQVFKIGIRNGGDKPIRGVKGVLEFVDIFGKRVGSVAFAVAENIAPSQALVWEGSRDYNQFLDEHKAVWNLEEGKFTTRFVPEQVVFADGTKLGASQ